MKNTMKKRLSAVLAMLLALSMLLCACGDKKSSDKSDDKSGETATIPVSILDKTMAVYGSVLNMYDNAYTDDLYGEGSMELVVGDDLKDLLVDLMEESQVPDAEELVDLLDGLSMDMEVGMQEDLMQVVMGLSHGGTTFLDIDTILDFENNDAYVAFPILTDKYVSMPQMMEGIDFSTLAVTDQLSALIEALPSEELVARLLTKYAGIALDSLDEPTKSTETVEIHSIEEKLTVYTTVITEEDAVRAVIAVLEALLEDEDVESVFTDLCDALGADDAYVSFYASVEAALFELKNQSDFDTETQLQLKDYRNSDDVSVGFDLSVLEGDEDVSVRYITVMEDDAFAMEVALESDGTSVAVFGQGVFEGNEMEANYILQMDGESLLEIDVYEYDMVAARKGYVKGAFEIIPLGDWMDELIPDSGMAGSFLSLMDLSLRYEVESSEKGGSTGIYLKNGEDVLVGLSCKIKYTDDVIRLPDEDDVVDADHMDEWIESIDGKAMLSALKKIGVPEELCAELEALFEQLEQGGDYPAMGDGGFNDTNISWSDMPI